MFIGLKNYRADMPLLKNKQNLSVEIRWHLKEKTIY